MEVSTSSEYQKPGLLTKEFWAPPSKRGLDFYLERTQVEAKDLEGKKILNLGAGGDNLGIELKSKGVSTQVTNIDLKYPRTLLGQTEIQGINLTPERAVKADISRLPLGNESVDVEFASESLTRWVSKDRQPQGFLEAVRVLKEGGSLYAFVFDWQSVKPTDVFTAVKSQFPSTQFEFDTKRKTLKITKAETNEPFENNTAPDPEVMLNSISSELLRKDISVLLSVAIQDVDNNRDSRRSVSSVVNSLTNIDLRKLTYTDASESDWESATKLLVTCVDAGDEFAGNSAFQRARKLVVNQALIMPERFTPKKGPELLKVAQEFDPDKAATLDKIRALQDALIYPTWFSDNANELNWLRENNPEGWRIAVNILRKNAISLGDDEKKAPLDYFKRELDLAKKGDQDATKRLEIFRILGHHYETDEVWSRFTQYHDPSVFGVAEYWSSSTFAGPIENIKRMFRKQMTLGDRELIADSRSDGNPQEFAKALIKILETPQDSLRNKIVLEQTLRLQECPSCYGYMAGFKAQKLLQETLEPDAQNVQNYDGKRVDFALKTKQTLRDLGYKVF